MKMKRRIKRIVASALGVMLAGQLAMVNVYATQPSEQLDSTEAEPLENTETDPVENAETEPVENTETKPQDEAKLPDLSTGWMRVAEDGSDAASELLLPEADPTAEEVYQRMIAMKAQYPEGMPWTNSDYYTMKGELINASYPNGITLIGGGCAGFAYILSDAAFGSVPCYERSGEEQIDQIRVGDIIRIKNQWGGHSVVVLEIGADNDTLTLAEGNFNSSIHWGRKITKSGLKADKTFDYLYTRYTEPATSSPTEPVQTQEPVQTPEPTAPADQGKVTSFVERLYQIMLDRDAEAEGLNNWTQNLMQGAKTGADVAEGFVLSPEYINKNEDNETFVEKMYLTFMDRGSDAGGKADWVHKLEQGYSRRYVAAGFINSDEFKNICASYGIHAGTLAVDDTRSDSNLYVDSEKVCAYVDSLYQNILGRSADPEGKADWVNRISTHQMGAAEVARIGFFTSKEYLDKNTTNEQFLQDIYAAFFNRKPDTAGYNDWLNRMKNGYTRDQVILEGFGQSAEFNAILRSYGLKCSD